MTTRKPVRKCDGCGHRKTDVKKVIDPYDQDVNNKTTMVKLCDDCYQNRVDDI